MSVLRRTFLTASGAAAASAAGLGLAGPAAAAVPHPASGTAAGSAVITPPARPFGLHEVRVSDASVFVRARTELLYLASVFPTDRLLAVFRRNAGLDDRGAQAPGSWEGFGHPDEQAWGPADYPGREHARTANLLRGHYAGHFLSMLAHATAGTGDPQLRARVDELVTGLAQVQTALAGTGRYSHPGFLAAYGEWQFSRLEGFAPYGEIWAPYYTCHKIMAGLVDAYELTGNTAAVAVATAMGEWVHQRLAPLTDAHRQRMWSLYIAGEFGGMNEVLARLARITGNDQFLTTASFFDQTVILDGGASGTDVLTNRHANQHLPQLVGYLEQYEMTGQARYLDGARGIFDQVVPGRTYAHGGTGEGELWGPPMTVAGDIGPRNAETCASYNLVKLARRLYFHTLEPRYLDYYERTVLNHVLGSRRAVRSDTSPEVAYMFPVHFGARREYGNLGTCCGGTGLENHVKYQDTVFSATADGVSVNLLLDSELDWRDAGLRLVLESGFPLSQRAVLRVERLPALATKAAVGAAGAAGIELPRTLAVRVPTWLTGPAALTVNGAAVTPAPTPGGFVEIQRAWRPGDEVVLSTPVALRLEPTVDDPRLYALRLGASLLLARSEARVPHELGLLGRLGHDGAVLTGRSGEQLITALRERGTVDIEGLTWEPSWSGEHTTYHMYVRSHDPEIAFGGVGTGAVNRRRADGGSFLHELWAPGSFADRAAFLDRVLTVASTVRSEGLLGRDELRTVLVAAAEFDGGQPGPTRRAVVVEPGAELAPILAGMGLTGRGGPSHAPASGRAEWVEPGDGGPVAVTVWARPPAAGPDPVPPAVTIDIAAEPAPSGWYTTAPVLELRGFGVDGDAGELTLQWHRSGEAWTAYRGPITLASGANQTIEARVTDAAGRTGTANRTLSVDLAAPRTRATVRDLGSTVEITLRAEDATSGVERIQWSGPGTFWGTYYQPFTRALGDQPQIIEFAGTDRAGNEEPRQRLEIPARPAG